MSKIEYQNLNNFTLMLVFSNFFDIFVVNDYEYS